MPISLKNPAVERALQELAELTGESLTEAAGQAFRERLARLKLEQARASARTRRRLHALIDEARRSKLVDPRTEKEVADELWGE